LYNYINYRINLRLITFASFKSLKVRLVLLAQLNYCL